MAARRGKEEAAEEGNRMEQITRREGKIFYGKELCGTADDAYCRFRDDYHCSLGKRAYYRLNRLGQREERVHGYGFSFATAVPPYLSRGLVQTRLLGIVGVAYCRIVGGWEIPCRTDEEFERWFDWAFSKGSRALRLVGKKDKSGRTNKRLKTKYR